MAHILIADDEGPKLAALREFVGSLFHSTEIVETRSVRTTIARMRERLPMLLVLDMSLPTFDIAPGEPGGRPQGFGGSEVLRYMDFYELSCPVVVVTQYEAFSDKDRHVDLSSITEELRNAHPSTFRGCVYYSSLTDQWQPELGRLLQEANGGTK